MRASKIIDSLLVVAIMLVSAAILSAARPLPYRAKHKLTYQVTTHVVITPLDGTDAAAVLADLADQVYENRPLYSNIQTDPVTGVITADKVLRFVVSRGGADFTETAR